MAEETNSELDTLDCKMLSELHLDGRQPASNLAAKLGISRTSACQRLRRLLDGKIVSIGALTNALALGYNALAVTGIQVEHGDLYAVADRLCAFPNVVAVILAVGWQDIIIWSLFPDQSELYGFTTGELGNVSGIRSTETVMIIEWRHTSPYLFSQWQRFQPYSHSSHLRNDGQERSAAFAQEADQGRSVGIDHLDLLILREMERDARQPVSHLAKRLGISRANASMRLNRLLDHEVTRIAAFTNSPGPGSQISAMIGMKVSPREINAVLERVETIASVDWVAKVLGRYDVLVGTTFLSPLDLTHLLGKDLDTIVGVLSTETIIGLEVMKTSFGYLASSYLDRIEKHLQLNGAGSEAT
jgi:Lrp/AsnC family transcriptional regulator for asnA, asnC and gidA